VPDGHDVLLAAVEFQVRLGPDRTRGSAMSNAPPAAPFAPARSGVVGAGGSDRSSDPNNPPALSVKMSGSNPALCCSARA
jgi:hypothetical protein